MVKTWSYNLPLFDDDKTKYFDEQFLNNKLNSLKVKRIEIDLSCCEWFILLILNPSDSLILSLAPLESKT